MTLSKAATRERSPREYSLSRLSRELGVGFAADRSITVCGNERGFVSPLSCQAAPMSILQNLFCGVLLRHLYTAICCLVMKRYCSLLPPGVLQPAQSPGRLMPINKLPADVFILTAMCAALRTPVLTATASPLA